MRHVIRLLCVLALLAFATTGPAMRAADQVKPRVRAITGFVTIDAKSYPSQLEETVTFLSRVRDAVTAAGYDVAGIRISTQPFPEYTRGLSRAEALAVLRGINDLAAKLRFAPNIGPAMVNDTDDLAPVELVTEVLSDPGNRLNANIVVAGDDGIHWNAVRQAARIIKGVGERSPHGQGNFNFAAIAMLKPYGPFYPGAWHPGTGPRSFAIGLEAANVVMDVFAREHDPRTAGKALTDALAAHARAVEAAAKQAAAGSAWTYAGIDPTPAPGGRASIGAAIESFTGDAFGAPGTETAAAIITRAVKDVPVKQTGYSGLMIPVLEDPVLTRRWTERTYGLDSILAYSAVCAGGVDTVPLAGDTSEAAIARIVGDVATLAFKWNKPLAARLLPAPGKKAGEMTEFSGALSNAIIQALPGAQVSRDPIVREGATTKVSPHVYVIPDDDVPLVPNVGIIVGSRATLVIDTGLGPKSGEAIVREVAKVSQGTELYLAVTHVHPEHDLGAQAFPAGTKMLRSRGQDADIAEFGLQLANTFASQSPIRAQLLNGAVYRKTDITIDRQYTLDLGGVRVRMETVGPTHTRGDTVFFVEGDATLFAGDVVMSAFPAFASPYSSVQAWLAAMDRLETMKPKVIVPSHGRLVDAGAITKYREYLQEVQSRTQALKRQGKSADEAAQLVQTALQTRFADMAQPGRIAGAVKAAYLEPVSGADGAPGATDWPSTNYDQTANRYSPLTQITTTNVGTLEKVWSVHLKPAGFTGPMREDQAIPIVIGNTMYLASPYGAVLALDATTGAEKWRFQLPNNELPSKRGVSYWPGGGVGGSLPLPPSIVFGSTTGKLYSLTAASGTLNEWFGENGVITLKTPEVMQTGTNLAYSLLSSPTIYKNLIITGAGTGEGPGGSNAGAGPAGDTRAWDARTGKLVWTFHTVPRPGEFGYDTWGGDSTKNRSGVNVWGYTSLDAERGILYMPLGAPNNDRVGIDRPGNNLFSSSVVAVDANTGKYLWHFQLVHHDIWDYDTQSAPLLVDLRRDGQIVPAVIIVNKTGLMFTLNRVTGKPIFDIEERPVPKSDVPGEQASPTQPFPVKPEPLAQNTISRNNLYKGEPQHQSYCEHLVDDNNMKLGGPYLPIAFNQYSVSPPGPAGGINFWGPSYDPELHLFVSNTSNIFQPMRIVQRPDGSYANSGPLAGTRRFGDPDRKLLCGPTPWGELVAVNMDTGNIAYRKTLGVSDALPAGLQDTGRPSSGGVILTASGLTFVGGTDDFRFRAFATATGMKLWEIKLPSSVETTPITYRGADGRQFVTVVSTGGGLTGSQVTNDEIIAFALPKK